MADNNKISCGGGSLATPIIFAAIGFFVYAQTLSGAIGMFLYSIVIGALASLGLIPILGPVLYFILANLISLKLLAWLGLTTTWLTAFIFWFYFTLSLIMTILVIIMIIGKKY
jgi:hypothetical protein